MTQPGGGEPLRKITLTDEDGTSYDLILQGGDKTILESWASPQPLTPGGAGKYGDFDPMYSWIEQRSWERGRGLDDFTDDPNRYYDGDSAWTLTPGKIFPTIAYQEADGFSDSDAVWTREPTGTYTSDGYPGGVSGTGQDWKASSPFTPTANTTIVRSGVWIKMRNDMASLEVTASIYDDSSGDPGSELALATNSFLVTDFDQYVWKRCSFEFAGQAVTAGTQYHLVLHFNVGPNDDASDIEPLLKSNTGGHTYDGTWAAAPSIMFTTWAQDIVYQQFFELQRVMHCLTTDAAGTSILYMNGDRGKATAGTTTTLTDSNEGLSGAWTDNQWIGGYVWIIDGTGEGQVRTITDSTDAGVLTFAAMAVAPDTTSHYVIVKPDDWQILGTTGIANCKSVAVVNNIAYFAEGYGQNIRRARWNFAATPPVMQYDDDSTNDADQLLFGGGYIFRGTNDDGKIGSAKIQNWGTDLEFSNKQLDTGSGFKFTSFCQHGDLTYAFKENSLWYMTTRDDIPVEYPISVGSMASIYNGQASLTDQEYLYFNWGYSLERLSGLTVDHIDPNSGAGIPSGRVGPISCLQSHPAGIFVGIDAGNDGSSSVLVWDGYGFHEVLRLFEGQRILDMAWQSVPDRQPILYTGHGDGVVYQEFPKYHTNPLKDSDVILSHHFELITSTIDMGSKGLTKMFKSLAVICDNLTYVPPSTYNRGVLFYQTDANIGTDTWDGGPLLFYSSTARDTGTNFTTTVSNLEAINNVTEIRFRICVNNQSRQSPEIKALTLKGLARTPTKRIWSIPIAISETMENLGSGDPDTFLAWIDDKAESGETVLVTSEYTRLHNVNIVIVPRTNRLDWIDANNSSFSSTLYLEMREA